MNETRTRYTALGEILAVIFLFALPVVAKVICDPIF